MNTLMPLVALIQAAGLTIIAGSAKGHPTAAKSGQYPDDKEPTFGEGTSGREHVVRDITRRLALNPDTAAAIVDADPGYLQRLHRYDAACARYWRASDNPDWDLAYLLTQPYPRFPFPATPLLNEPFSREDKDQTLHHLHSIGVQPQLAQALVDHDPGGARYLLRIAHDADILDEISHDIEVTAGAHAANLFRRINQLHPGHRCYRPILQMGTQATPVLERTLARVSDPEPSSARQVVNEMMEACLLDDLLDQARGDGPALTGPGGFLPELVKAVLDRGLQAELAAHLGHEKHDPAGRGTPNFRNGSRPRTFTTEVGTIRLDMPRDRNSTFRPRLAPKSSRRLGGLEEMIVSRYAGGMTIRDLQRHLTDTLGAELSHGTISKITKALADEINAWRTRQLAEVYPLLYPDTVQVKVRDGDEVRAETAHVVVGVDLAGANHVLGIWARADEHAGEQADDDAEFWAGVCAELRNRGVRDVLIVCGDGQRGFTEAVEATWPNTMAQTCTMHLIRAAMRFVSP